MESPAEGVLRALRRGEFGEVIHACNNHGSGPRTGDLETQAILAQALALTGKTEGTLTIAGALSGTAP
jgi:hypothetical protein